MDLEAVVIDKLGGAPKGPTRRTRQIPTSVLPPRTARFVSPPPASPMHVSIPRRPPVPYRLISPANQFWGTNRLARPVHRGGHAGQRSRRTQDVPLVRLIPVEIPAPAVRLLELGLS